MKSMLTSVSHGYRNALRNLRLPRVPTVGDASCFLRHLRYPTRASTLRAAVDGLFVSWTIKRRGVRPLLETARPRSRDQDPLRSCQIARAVDAGLGVIPIAPTCLRRSLTLIRELDRLGLDATLHIGVRSVAGKIAAHAWIQVQDIVINDDPAVTDTYEVLAEGDLEAVLPSLA